MSAGFSSMGSVLGVGLISGIIISLGFLALCIPGFLLMTMYWLAIPIAVVESPGVTASLSRSAELTSGNRWAVFGTAFIMGMIHGGVGFVVGIVTAIIGAMASGGATVTGAGGGMAGFVQLLQGLFLLPFDCLIAIAPVVAYHDLRVGKEGADIEDLVKVFE
jgi:hypothetical protein